MLQARTKRAHLASNIAEAEHRLCGQSAWHARRGFASTDLFSGNPRSKTDYLVQLFALKQKQTAMKHIEITIDPAALPIFQSSVGELGRLLNEKLPGTKIAYQGRPDESKDAAAIITAAADFLGKAAPIISTLVTVYLASRGCKVTKKKDGTMEVAPAGKKEKTRTGTKPKKGPKTK